MTWPEQYDESCTKRKKKTNIHRASTPVTSCHHARSSIGCPSSTLSSVTRQTHQQTEDKENTSKKMKKKKEEEKEKKKKRYLLLLELLLVLFGQVLDDTLV